MKQFIAFVRKEFFHIFRDRRTMLILLGMPVVQIILFGFAISTEVKNVRVAVLDPNNDVMTRHIVDRINASEYFMVTRLLHSPQEVERPLGRGIPILLLYSVHSLPTGFMPVMPRYSLLPMPPTLIWQQHR